MPKLKQRKDGGYFIHKSGDSNSVNTFQTTDHGASIVKSSGRELGEYFPDQLFYLLYDLGHLSTKGDRGTEVEINDINNIEWATDELSAKERVEVACRIIDTHGVGQLLQGDAASWVLTLIDQSKGVLKPLINRIAEESGYSYETIIEYSELIESKDELVEVALTAHLQMKGMETKSFDSFYAEKNWEILGTEGNFVYLSTEQKHTRPFGIVGEIPTHVPEDLNSQINHVWGHGVGAAGFAALSSIEVQREYTVEDGIVLPHDRLEDFPVKLPPRSELTEQYEAFRLLQSHIEQVLSSPEADVEYGDGSCCDLWYQEIHERLFDENSVHTPLGAQQRNRLNFAVQTYRDCYGDGEKVTDFDYIKRSQPSESEQVRLFGFGIFSHGETIRVPISPESEEPLPIYPQSQHELDHATGLLDEFRAKPETGSPS